MPQDMSAVGNAASASKKTTGGGSKSLSSFSVKKGDNGGVIVSETYESKAPEGRRAGASFPDRTDFKENPFGPSDQGAARAHITGLLAQMTGSPERESPAENRAEGGVEEPGERPLARPPVAARPAAPPMPRPMPMRPPSGPYGG